MCVLPTLPPPSPGLGSPLELELTTNMQVDDSELADELAELEQDELNKRLAGAEAAPLHSPGATAAGPSLPHSAS